MVDVPTAFVIALAGLTVVLQGCALLELTPLRSRVASVGLAGFFLATWISAVVLLPRRPMVHGEPIRVGITLVAPAVLAGYALWARVTQGRDRLEWFLGGDNIRHLAYVSDLLRSGNLSYAEMVYPRAWHGVLATGWAAGTSRPPGEHIVGFVELGVTSTWVLVAVWACAVSVFTNELLTVVNIRGLPAMFAVGVSGMAILTPRFVADYLAMGFQTSILGSLIMVVVARELLMPTIFRQLLVASAGFVAIAHVWQLLLPGAAVALLLIGLQRGAHRRDATYRVVVVAAWMIAGIAGWAPVWSLVRNADPRLVGAAGATPQVPWGTIVVGSLATLSLVLAATHRRAVCWTLLVVFAPAATALAVVTALGLQLTDYYPTKLLWTTAALVVPFAAVAMSLGLTCCSQLVLPLRMAVGTGVLTSGTAIVLVGLLTPSGAFSGSWATVDASRVLPAVAQAGARATDVVWMDSITESAVTRTLLTIVDPGWNRDDWSEQPTIREECRRLRASASAQVMSSHPLAETEDRYTCADITVLPVPG